MCVSWNRTNGPVNQTVCGDFAATVQNATALLSLNPMTKNYTCSSVTGTLLTVCGDYATDEDAAAVGAYLNNGGFDSLALAINFGNGEVVVGGEVICAPSLLTYVITDMSGTVCGDGLYAVACVPAAKVQFPYCTCEPGVAIKTPYDIKYARKFVTGTVNHYCFKVQVNKAQCGTARCCSMDLDKIEWLSDEDNCLQSVDGWTVSTAPNQYRAPVWARVTDTGLYPDRNVTMGILKSNNLNLTMANANGAEICIGLKGNSKCSTMEQFCFGGVCQFAIFDRSAGCCAQDLAPGNYFGSYIRRRL